MKKMEPLLSKTMSDLLGHARELGGEELVEGIMKAKEFETQFSGEIRDAHMRFMQTCEDAKLPEALACASACNALSDSYALVVALLGSVVDDNGTDLLTSALRSFAQNFERQTENVAAFKEGIAEKIDKAAKDYKEEKKA